MKSGAGRASPAGPSTGEVTLLLAEIKRGNSEALTRLMPLVYRELRRLAGHCMRDERTGHTLQATALVHEAYLRLVGQDRADWQNRAQFLAVAAQLMRRILVDHARRRAAAKRAGAASLEDAHLNRGANLGQAEEILAVEEALLSLGRWDERQARVVELRYFGGLSVEETAEAMGISPRTVKTDWTMAKAWLREQLAVRAPP
jgi:RNA polymerase sigma factor (TIGR02999 family)